LSATLRSLRQSRYSVKMAEAITSPEGMAMLKELRDLSSTSGAARIRAGQFVIRFLGDDVVGE